MIASNSRNVSNSKKVVRYASNSIDADDSRDTSTQQGSSNSRDPINVGNTSSRRYVNSK
jgi:hypothetical protein